ncbi:S8 family peptidase [Stenotrophomonas sp. CFBP 13718]|nr:S8 family peptidase [Stenotrophomonas sp. CFBP 13718]
MTMKLPSKKTVLSLVISSLLAAACSASAVAGDVDTSGLEQPEPQQQFIVHLRGGRSLQHSESTMQAALDRAGSRLHVGTGDMRVLRQMAAGPMVVRAERAMDRAEAGAWMAALASDPDVDHVQVDRILQPALDPNDVRLNEQWGFSNSNASLNVRQAWDKATGAGQVVAIIDTGRTRHPELDANTLPGYDFISSASMAGDGNGRDDNPDDVGDSQSGSSSSWHGTHVAGTVAAATNNGQGVAGTAFDAKLVHVRVLGKGGGYTSDIADGMVWAAGGTVNGVPRNANPAKVLNLSLGGQGACDRAWQAAVDAAIRNGATVVVAAGNSNADVSRFTPASCRGVVAVAATTSRGARASFSNYGAGITLAAPGEGILSTLNTGTTTPEGPGYAVYNGTSMAAPHVAGVVALMQSAADGKLTPDQVVGILKTTARPLPGACSQGCGAGIANAKGAVDSALEAASR